ncbi:DUF368 domain-containing protein [Paenibacillus senegalensis]|uniref:DUF368 domain-containing protein n=1 Tax=Paenibacillus senegalensis TaxID=1465766 RepID=UPI0002880DA3|nr:DUF368 domain-containing protein [Paenibacillus senegalensis]
MEWRNLWRGVVMGITDLIPGISGGTMAVILGIYQRLIEAINGLISREWKKHVLYLIPVGLGMVAAIFGFSRVMDWLLANAAQPTYFFFIGLILGIVPYLFNKIEFRRTFTPLHYGLLLVAAAAVYGIGLLRAEETGAIIESPALNEFIFLFFAGWLASAALILPGISGTFLLLLLGLYPTVINALKTFNLPVIIVVGAGIVIGILLTSKVVHALLKRFTIGTYAVVIGMVLGATIVIFPGFGGGALQLVLSIVTFLGGLAVAVFLGKMAHD